MVMKTLEQNLRNLFVSCADVQTQTYTLETETQEEKVLLMFCAGMVDSAQMNLVIPKLNRNEALPLEPIPVDENWATVEQLIVEKVFSGEMLLFFERKKELFSLNISKVPQRQPEESTYEVSIKGARDGFTESVETNVALIRKRVKSTTLCNESFVIGKRSQTKVSLLYLSDVINTEILEEARARLNAVDVDIVNGTSPLEELLADTPFSLVPLLNYTSRPDFVVESLQRGRFCILIDGAPAALVAPVNLQFLFKSIEDSYMPYYFVSIERLLRYIGSFITIFLPGFYVSLVSYQVDNFPFQLLATFTLNSYGIPIAPTTQAIIMLVLFELLRAAGARLPKPVGATVTVVGGLIVGDTLIRSGLIPANLVVVIAVTLMTQFLLANQALSTSVMLFRMVILLSSSVLGLIGFYLAVYSIFLYLTTLRSFGVPLTAELIDPIDIKMLKSYIMFPKPFMRDAPKFLKTKKTQRQGDENN
jgi:hypothetical protein